jgi:hypothetical protein
MCNRYTYAKAEEQMKERGVKMYLVVITKQGDEHKIEIGEM